MEKITKIIQEYRFVLLLAVFCGAVYVAPHLFFKITLGNSFHGIELTPRDAETHYLSMLNEVKQGYLTHSSTYLYEYKDSKVSPIEYSETFYGTIIKLFNLGAPGFYLFCEFFFPVVIFLLWYYFSLLVTKNKRSAILSALFLMFGTYILSNVSIIKQFDILFWKTANIPLLAYGRIINPLLTFPFFFAGLIFAYKLFSENTKKMAVFSGIALGIMFYVYFYFWTYFLALSFLMLVFGVSKKEWQLVKNISLSISISLLIGSYFIVSMIKTVVSSVGVQSGGSLSPYVFALSHNPSLPSLVVLGVALFSFFIYLRRRKGIPLERGDAFIFLLLSTAVVVVNQQIITGRSVEPGHFHWYANVPVFFLTVSYIIVDLLGKIRIRYLGKTLFIILCLYLITFGIGTQVSGYKQRFDNFSYIQKYGAVFDWFNRNTEKESVIFGGNGFSDLTPAYTQNNVYFAAYGAYYPSNPLERRIHTAYIYYFLDNKKEDILQKIYPSLTSNGCVSAGCVDSDIFAKTMANYGEFLKTPFYENLKKYRVDYMVWDKNTNPSWNLDKFSFLKPVYNYDNVLVYKILNK
ncbi:MAG: hypothetical protein WC835_00330 [Candidatus Paceibacterota bacterium]|jgi:hypothetical protein